MTADVLDPYLDGFAREAFRYDDGRDCVVKDEQERVRAWQTGQPRPVRSVRTSAWLASIARATLNGKLWRLAVALGDPLTTYQAYRITGLVEGQAAGIDTWVTRYDKVGPLPNFWLFDSLTAVELSYDDEGHPAGQRLVRDSAEVMEFARWRDHILAHAVPLNEWLAAHPGVLPRVA